MEEGGEAIIESIGKALGLARPAKPWHTQRDRLAGIVSVFGILAGNLGKIARDISLLSQTEIGELKESNRKGRGGSSTMPQKSNPVASISILANAERIPALVAVMFSSLVQDHERGTGPWHAEWETLPEIAQLTAGALSRAVELISGLEIDKDRMLQNLEISKGLIYAENISMALVPMIGRKQAHELVKECCITAQSSHLHLEEVCATNPVICKYIKKEDLKNLFDPYHSLGLSEAFIDKVVTNIS
jgi:3-carboxy-cis,cis-muconate cycloisomerase